MTTAEQEVETAWTIPDDIEEVEYPPEVVAELIKIAEETEARYAAGEISAMTAKEFRAEVMRRRAIGEL